MRNLLELNVFRRFDLELKFYRVNGGKTEGLFEIPSVEDKQPIKVIASVGEGWEHVSVSRSDRVPSYYEMEQITELFALLNETWMQLHVPKADHVNCHLHCLHWWRPMHKSIPRPPAWMVGVKN